MHREYSAFFDAGLPDGRRRRFTRSMQAERYFPISYVKLLLLLRFSEICCILYGSAKPFAVIIIQRNDNLLDFVPT